MFIPTVTCYCDIPFEQTGPHISKYGNFGLSFSRHFLTKHGARPVFYIPCRPDDWRGVFTGHTIFKELEATYKGITEQRVLLEKESGYAEKGSPLTQIPKSPMEALQQAEHSFALRLLAFIKPYESTLEDSIRSITTQNVNGENLGIYFSRITTLIALLWISRLWSAQELSFRY